MKEENILKLKAILKDQLNREPTKDELANAQTDHSLISQLAFSIAEEAQGIAVAAETRARAAESKAVNAELRAKSAETEVKNLSKK